MLKYLKNRLLLKKKESMYMLTVNELKNEFEEKLNRDLKEEEIDFIKWIVENQPHEASA